MKNKFVVLLCSLMFLLFTFVCVKADVLKVLSARAKFPVIIEPVITHTIIGAVSSIDKILNAKILVDFGSYVSAKAKIIYYKNDDPSSKQEEPASEGKTISNKNEFFIDLPQVSDSDSSISYQIQIALKDAGGNTIYKYFPLSEDDFIVTSITNSTTSFVTADTGGKIVFESGNQEYKNTELNVPANSISNDTNITLTQLPIESQDKSKEMVAMYKVESATGGTEILSPLSLELYYGITTNKDKFDLMYRKDETSSWEKVTISQIDSTNKIILAEITKFGEYAIFVSGNLNDNDYRPTKRVKVKSRISTYGGFKFANLKEGDVVKIFSVSGKKIAELTSGTNEGFEWRGRKGTNNSGDWAESGTYIYQIKLNKKGKVISGTIAFVW